MVRTFFVLLMLLAGLTFLWLVVADDTPKRRIALHEPMTVYGEP